MSSEHGATVDGDNQSIDQDEHVVVESNGAVEPGSNGAGADIDKVKFSESSQSTDNLFDWMKVANHAYDSGDLENAKQCYLRALDLCDEEDDADHTQRLVCLNRLGEICLKLKQPDLAFQIFARARPQTAKGSLSERTQRFALNIAVLVFAVVSCLSVTFPSPSIKVIETGNNDSMLNLSTKSSIAAAIKSRSGASDKKFVSPVQVGAEFKTPDQLSTLKIADLTTLYRWDHGEVWGAKYVSPNFSFSDILKLTSGCRKNSEHFVITSSDYLVDDAGLIFYGPDAPEVKVVERMWWYPSFINFCYEKFKKYPTQEEPWMNTVEGYTFKNPFTGATEKASFVSLSHPDEAPPSVAKPGAILLLSTPAGDCTICGYDRNSRLVTSSNPGRPLLLQLRKGINVTDQYLKGFGGMSKPKRPDPPELFVFISDPAIKSLMENSETYVPAIAVPLWFASLTLSLFLFRVFLKSPGRMLAFSPMVLPSILIVMVLFMSFGE